MQYNLWWIGSEFQLQLFFRVSVLAEIAQLGERQTEDPNVPGSIPGFGNIIIFFHHVYFFLFNILRQLLGQETKKTKTSDALLS